MAAETYFNMHRLFEPFTNKTTLISHPGHKNNVLYSYLKKVAELFGNGIRAYTEGDTRITDLQL